MSEEPLTDAEHAAWWDAGGEEQLRELLFWRWDPIGVADAFPHTWDEYDRYAPRVVAVLRARGDVAAELTAIARDVIGLDRSDDDDARTAAAAIADWYARAIAAWARRGEHRSSRWRARATGRRRTRVVPLTDPEPPPLDGAPPAIAVEGETVTVAWPAATLTLTGVVATAVGPSHPLGPARPGVFSEVLDSPWIAQLTAIRRAELGPVRHLVLPLGNQRFLECVCAGAALS